MKDFRQLLIWKKAMDITEMVYALVVKFPSEEKFGLRAQVTRCSVSIAANIAEGSARSSQKEYRYFSEVALGSCFELETHFLIAERLKWFDKEEISKLLAMLTEEQKMLTSFINKLKSS